MRYESMVIVDPIKGKSETDQVGQSLKSLIEKCGGSNVDVENYGERKLAYRIKKFKRGYYYLIHFDMEGENVPKLRREFKLNDDVFRYLVIKDEDEGFERRDLAKPTVFNVDALGSRTRFERSGDTRGDFDEAKGRSNNKSSFSHDSTSREVKDDLGEQI